MTEDDRSRKGKGSAEEEGADEATRLRPGKSVGAREDDADEATRLRSSSSGAPDEEDEATRLRTTPPAQPAAGQGDEDEEVTQFRSAPSAPATPPPATTSDDEDEATQFRSTGAAQGPADEDDEATRFRAAPDDADSTEINSRTRQLPRTGRGRLEDLAPGAADDAEDPTRMRAPEPEEDATRMRAPDSSGDDDPTVGAHGRGDALVDDDDATVQAGGVDAVHDDEATVQADGGPAGARRPPLSDDDATVQGGGTASPPPRKAAPARARTSAQAAASLGVGTVLKGRFTLEDKLGAGGMGGVFKAVDLVKQEARDRNPYVAVKVMNESFADHPDAFIALQRESSRTQKLSHPNIASVYDFDRDGDVAYMIMELLEGDPLDKHLKANKNGLEREEARGIIRDISSALAYAHAQGLIHSDFKPGNIFWTKSGTAKVFDFGIARAAATGEDPIVGGGPVDIATLEKDDGSDKTLFDAGKLGALTPAYAAIEMFEGRDPAPQDDVYALGIVAYQCLTGKHPFNRQKAPVAEAKNMVPERPDGLTRREWNAIRHALAFRREDRTPDAQAFLDEFFGVTGQAVRAALIGVFGMAAVVVGLYFAGVIGPAQNIQPPDSWVELETQIESARQGVEEQLQSPELGADDQFVAWEGIIRRELSQWQEIASPRLVIGDYLTEAGARSARKQAFEQGQIALRLLQPGEDHPGRYALAAGPWSGPDAKSDLETMEAKLKELGMPYIVQEDSEAIAKARDDALSIYLGEVERRLPKGDAPKVRLIKDEDGNFTQNQDDVTALNDGLRKIESAETVLARAKERFPTRPDDIAAMERRVKALHDEWQGAITDGNQRESAENRRALAERTREASQAAINQEKADLYKARTEGGEVQLFLTGNGATSSHLGVFPTFRQRCDDTAAIDTALADYSALEPADQTKAIQYAYDCIREKLGQSTDAVLRSRDHIVAKVDPARVAAVDLANLKSVQRPDPCANRGYVGYGKDAFCLDPLAAGGNAPPVVVVPGLVRADNTYGIGKYEVSVGDYNRYCKDTGCAQLPGPDRLPATDLSVDEARAYLAWLTKETGRVYRLPTLKEWKHAAEATGGAADANRNCYSNVRGVVRGENLVTVGQGAPNEWGLVNAVGNADEWVTQASGGLAAAGGRHTDPLAQCTVNSLRDVDGTPDPSTGFRVLRQVGN